MTIGAISPDDNHHTGRVAVMSRRPRHPSAARRCRNVAIVAVAVAVLAGACASGSSPQAGTSVTTATASTSSSAAGSGMTALQPTDQASLEAAFAAGVSKTGAPGGVAIVDTPQGRFTLSAGTNEVGRDVKPSPTDHFRIASTTKTMVGAVILQLAQEGKLRLDDPVSTYVGGVPGGDQITIEQLLNMRSGLPSYTNTSEIGGAIDRDPTRVWTPQELLAAAFKNPPHAAPGTAFYYSNTNTVLAGLIIEKLDGKSLAQSLHDRLFEPLGMNDTSLPPPASNALPEPHGRGYLYGTNEIFVRIDPTLPPDLQAQLDAGTLPRHDVTDENPSWGWAAGNGISTAHDMTIWIDALVDGKVLNPEYQQKWLAPGGPTDPAHPDGIHYGLAHYSIATPDGHILYGHSGEMPGFNTWMLRDPVNDVTIVAWANLAPNHGDEAFIGALINTLYRTPTTSDTTASGNAGPSAVTSFAGLVDIGGGRQMYLQCQGSGSPTVVLVSGAQGAHDDWTHVADTNNPVATPQPSDTAVFPQVARFTRVCAFDRPGTTLISGAPSPSTPVSQPTTARAGVTDLTAVLAAAHEPAPYVLVGASWGGMIANLYARTNPSAMAGLVLVDAASEFLNDTLTPAQWTAWMGLNQTMATTPPVEIPDYQAAVDEIRAAPALPDVPAIVLTADQPWNLPLGDAGPTWTAWMAAQDRLAGLLHATHIANTDSGHPININQPALVADAVHDVVDAVRRDGQRPQLDAASRALLDQALDEGFARSGAAGATVGVWIPGRGEWVATRGVADRTTSEPMSRDMQAPIGSVTKTYTVLVALQLVGDGLLNLDDTIDRWYPTYPQGGAITIRMLMNHSSGIAEITQPQLDIKCPDPHQTVDPDTLIDISAAVPRAAFAPGEGYQYSSANTIILGRIMEKFTGSSYEALLSQRLFEPLGLTRTRLASDGVLEPPFAHGYTDFCAPARPKGTDTATWTLIAFSAGALTSTIDDLHDYGVAFGEGLGLTEALKKARTDQSAPGDPTSGLGLVAQRDPASDALISIGHAGSEPGYGANLAYYPCSGTVFAAMTNADVDPALTEILTAVQPLVQELATKDCAPDTQSPPPHPPT